MNKIKNNWAFSILLFVFVLIALSINIGVQKVMAGAPDPCTFKINGKSVAYNKDHVGFHFNHDDEACKNYIKTDMTECSDVGIEGPWEFDAYKDGKYNIEPVPKGKSNARIGLEIKDDKIRIMYNFRDCYNDVTYFKGNWINLKTVGLKESTIDLRSFKYKLEMKNGEMKMNFYNSYDGDSRWHHGDWVKIR